MKLSQYISRNMGVIMFMTLIFFIILSVTQAIFDVSREQGSVDNLLYLQKKIHHLNDSSNEDFQKNLQEIIDYCHTKELRHLHLTIRDTHSRIILDIHPKDSPNILNTFFTKIVHMFSFDVNKQNEVHVWESGVGANKTVFEMYSNPISEQNEIAENLFATTIILICFTLITFFAVRRNLSYALKPLEESLTKLKQLSIKNYTGILPASRIEEVNKVNDAINLLSASLIDLEKARQMLSVKLISSIEEDRLRISRDMHDELGQKLAMIRLSIGYLDRLLKENQEVSVVLADMKENVTGIHQSVKSIIAKISNIDLLSVLDDSPFDEILIDLIKSWERMPGNQITYDYQVNLGARTLSKTLKLILFRITQEAITNMVKHSNAKNICVRINCEGDQLVWIVEDDGLGMLREAEFFHKGNGLAGMQERVWSVGGYFEIKHNHNNGMGFSLTAKFKFVLN